MTQSAKGVLAVLALLAFRCASAADIVVVGKLITNEPMSYVGSTGDPGAYLLCEPLDARSDDGITT